MVTVIVQFGIGAETTLEEVKQVFRDSVPRYRQVPGLLRKYYLIAEDGKTAGGAYLWQSRTEAEALYTAEWVEMIKGKYGSAPEVRYFDTPVVLDNEYDKTTME